MAVVYSLSEDGTNLLSNSTYLVTSLDSPVNIYLPETPSNGDTIIIVDRDGTFNLYPCTVRSVFHKLVKMDNNSLELNSSFCNIQLIFYEGLWSLYGAELFQDLTGTSKSIKSISNTNSYTLKPNTQYLLYLVNKLYLPSANFCVDGDQISLSILENGGTTKIYRDESESESSLAATINHFSSEIEFTFYQGDWIITQLSTNNLIANRPEIFSAMTAMNTL